MSATSSTSPAARSRSSDVSSVAGARPARARSGASSNSRPSTAATCATARASPRRSRRAVSESRRVAGTLAAAPARSSTTVLVSSSTNSGTPSLRATISRSLSSSIPCRAATARTIAALSPAPSGLQVIADASAWRCHGGVHSGRCETNVRIGTVAMRLSRRSSRLLLVGSIQCASSTRSSSPGPADSATRRSSSRPIVSFMRCAGVISIAVRVSLLGSSSSSATRTRAALSVRPRRVSSAATRSACRVAPSSPERPLTWDAASGQTDKARCCGGRAALASEEPLGLDRRDHRLEQARLADPGLAADEARDGRCRRAPAATSRAGRRARAGGR